MAVETALRFRADRRSTRSMPSTADPEQTGNHYTTLVFDSPKKLPVLPPVARGAFRHSVANGMAPNCSEHHVTKSGVTRVRISNKAVSIIKTRPR